MTQSFNFLLGISVNSESSPLLLFSCSILFLAIVALLCIINIIIYYTIITIFEDTDRIERLTSKLP